MTALSIARALAEALDHEDYAAATALLHPDCAYTVAAEEHRGPEPIVASYKKSGDWVRETLDAFRYTSKVRDDGEGAAVITYFDHLVHRGIAHTHTCEQRVEVDPDGLVVRITHHSLPGEGEKLDRFFKQVGIEDTLA